MITGCNNSIDMILFYDSVNRQFHHILQTMINGTLMQDSGKRDIGAFCVHYLAIRNYTCNIGKNALAFCTLVP